MAWTEQIGEHSWRVRYIGAGGRIASIGGFANKLAAEDYALIMEHEQRRGVWVDPRRGRMTLADWAVVWFDSLDVDERTRDNYGSQLRRHILARWGDTRLCDISTLQITAWITDLHGGSHARATVSGIVKLLSMMLTDAVDDGIIPGLVASSPPPVRAQGQRRGVGVGRDPRRLRDRGGRGWPRRPPGYWPSCRPAASPPTTVPPLRRPGVRARMAARSSTR